MKKINLYAISKCPAKAEDEDFMSNLCTIVSRKKEVGEYIFNRVIIDNYDHYSRWLTLHYVDGNDTHDRRKEYIVNVLDYPNVFKDFYVKKMTYTADSVASLLRITCGCLPVGCGYEKDSEVNAIIQSFTTSLDDLFENPGESSGTNKKA